MYKRLYFTNLLCGSTALIIIRTSRNSTNLNNIDKQLYNNIDSTIFVLFLYVVRDLF